MKTNKVVEVRPPDPGKIYWQQYDSRSLINKTKRIGKMIWNQISKLDYSKRNEWGLENLFIVK